MLLHPAGQQAKARGGKTPNFEPVIKPGLHFTEPQND